MCVRILVPYTKVVNFFTFIPRHVDCTVVVAQLTIHEIRGGNQVTVNKQSNKVKNEEKEAL